MIEEPDIDELAQEEDQLSIESEDLSTTPKPRFVGYKTLGLASLIAALVGTLGGATTSKLLSPPTSDLSPLQSKIESVVSENKTLKAQLSRMQRDLKKTAPATPVDLSGLKARLKTLEDAKPAIIESSAPAIDPDLVARLEALQAEGSDALDLSDILSRVQKLEKMSLETKGNLDQEALVQQIKSEIMADETFLQKKLSDDKIPTVKLDVAETSTSQTQVLPFPKTTILEALDKADESQSWIKRTLNKNITVQSEDNPRYLVELIEMDLTAEKYSDALTKFDKLPEIAKSAGKEWREAFKGQ